ncbi:MAG: hypothetical protein JWN43_3203 [Gammaproteobacteria bacterium]|jgi:hypothetical protein|nr:hypothetical protein [Gammaproteobacteria bacterium]
MRYLLIPIAAIPAGLLLTGCVAEVTPPRVAVIARPPEVYVPAPPRAVVSVYVEPPISQPEPIAVGWAPPPLLVESPPPPPFDGAVWVGGYWVWQGDWVWAHGHWVGAPRPSYLWVHPYYENRDGMVIFINGHWSPPDVAFVPPPPGIHLTVEIAAAGVIAGPRPMGPNGCFIPPPPGSRPGIIIPAPIGTAPAVVTGAPPVVAVGMRVTNNINNTNVVHNNTTINNTTNNVTNNVTNVKNVTNITNVTIVAPPSATASGQAVNTSVPAQAHLAAAQKAVVKAQAPEPASSKPIPAFVHGRAPAPLPPAQAVNAASSGAQQARANTPHADNVPHPDNQGHAAPASAGQPATAKNGEQARGGNAQVAADAKANQHPGANASKDGGTSGAITGRPQSAGAKQDKANKDSRELGRPANPQVAAANAQGKPVKPGKHPNVGKPPVKDKTAPAAAKNKGEHPKKPGGKDEKQDHEKAG